MPHHWSRVLLVSALLGIGIPPAVHAQMTPAMPAAPANPALDPAAKTTLDAAVAAHKALMGLDVTLKIQSSHESQTLTLVFQKPNLAKSSITDTAGLVTQSATDGKTITVYSARDKKYMKEAVPGTHAIGAITEESGALLPVIFSNPDVIGQLFTRPGVKVVPGSAGTVAGVACDTVTATLPGPGGAKANLNISIGTDDHLLRQIEEVVSVPGGQANQVIHTETVTSLTLNPTLTASDFAFAPPAGTKKVASLEPPMYDPRLVKGAKPFRITAKDLKGQPLSLAQYKGKVVLMDFWATWCGPCVGEMPNVIAAYKKYHAQGFDVLGISLDQDKSALTSFIKQNKMPWRQVFDGKQWESAVPRQYGVRAIPFGLLLNRDGTIAAIEVRGPALPVAIKQALARK